MLNRILPHPHLFWKSAREGGSLNQDLSPVAAITYTITELLISWCQRVFMSPNQYLSFSAGLTPAAPRDYGKYKSTIEKLQSCDNII